MKQKQCLAAAAAAMLLACQEQHPKAEYALTSTVHACIHTDFSAVPGKAGGREYQAHSETWVRLNRADSADGLITVILAVDSIHFFSAERDTQELSFMRNKLRGYAATWRMTPDGRIPSLSEKPEFPHGEFTYRIGPLLAAALPVFFPAAARPGTVEDTQSFFDPGEPHSVMLQSALGSDRALGNGGVTGKRHWTLRLDGIGRDGATLAGEGEFIFDPRLGFPQELHLELSGDLPADSGNGTGAGIGLRMQLAYRFELLEPASP